MSKGFVECNSINCIYCNAEIKKCRLSHKPTELNGQCSRFKEYDMKSCTKPNCIHYNISKKGKCELGNIPDPDNWYCTLYQNDIKEKKITTETCYTPHRMDEENTCPHCGHKLNETSIEIARSIRQHLKYIYNSKVIDKMAENYEEAIIDAVEDERERIIKSINEINDFSVDAIRTVIIKKIRDS